MEGGGGGRTSVCSGTSIVCAAVCVGGVGQVVVRVFGVSGGLIMLSIHSWYFFVRRKVETKSTNSILNALPIAHNKGCGCIHSCASIGSKIGRDVWCNFVVARVPVDVQYDKDFMLVQGTTNWVHLFCWSKFKIRIELR